MDLNWCPVCEQHIPLAWESSLYCSDRCKKADALSSHPALGYAYPADLQSFPQKRSPSLSPVSSPTLTSLSTSNNAYPSPPTSPNQYLYNKTSSTHRISPPAFSLGNSAMVDLRRKSTTQLGNQGHSMMIQSQGTTTSSKKGFFW
ncbi:hypothetical protein BGW42_002552 [Actinomortierella wolfii]|nr:hypothetical protein BGW42_002552 [Actinomortierella wolfii]